MTESKVFTTTEILERLEILRHKLENQGAYVGANTAGLAIYEIKRLAALTPGKN